MLTLGALGAFANSWFLFLICNRSLNGEGFANKPMHKMMPPKNSARASMPSMKASSKYKAKANNARLDNRRGCFVGHAFRDFRACLHWRIC